MRDLRDLGVVLLVLLVEEGKPRLGGLTQGNEEERSSGATR
jgi:hypothetical protein